MNDRVQADVATRSAHALIGGAAGVALAVVAIAAYFTAVATGHPPSAPPLFAVVCVLCAVVAAGCAALLRDRGHARAARWALALSASLAGYVIVAALAGATAATGSSAAEVFVALEGGWYTIPLSIGGCLVLSAIEDITGREAAERGWRTVIVVVTAAAIFTGLVSVAPETACEATCPPSYEGLDAPLADVLPREFVSVVAVAFGVASALWMASILIAPARAWIAARRHAGLIRARLVILAVGASTPILTLITYALLLAAAQVGLMDADGIAATLLSLAFCAPTAVVAWSSFIAHTARDDGVTGAAARSVRWVLSGLWFVIGAEIACLAAALIAEGAREGATLIASVVALVLGILFVAAFNPVAKLLASFIARQASDTPADADPDEVVVGELSPREREVLALIAAGFSNAGIATELYLSLRTVDNHVTHIFNKLGLGRSADVNRRVQAAAKWIEATQARTNVRRPD